MIDSQTKTARQYWEFTFTVDEVLTACKRKIDGYRSRIDYWTEQFAEANQRLQEAGITWKDVREPSYNSTQVFSAPRKRQAVVDSDLEHDANYKFSAIKYNEDKLKPYLPYLFALQAEPDGSRELVLKVEDVNFFGIGEAEWNPVDEEENDHFFEE